MAKKKNKKAVTVNIRQRIPRSHWLDFLNYFFIIIIFFFFCVCENFLVKCPLNIIFIKAWLNLNYSILRYLLWLCGLSGWLYIILGNNWYIFFLKFWTSNVIYRFLYLDVLECREKNALKLRMKLMKQWVWIKLENAWSLSSSVPVAKLIIFFFPEHPVTTSSFDDANYGRTMGRSTLSSFSVFALNFCT